MFLIEDASDGGRVILGSFDMASARISGRFLIRNAIVEAPADVTKGSIYASSTPIGTALSAARLSVGAEVIDGSTLRGDGPYRHVDGRHGQHVHRRGLRATCARHAIVDRRGGIFKIAQRCYQGPIGAPVVSA